MSRDEILALLRAHKPVLERRFGIVDLALFGSFARDSATASSDIDILVEFEPNHPVGFLGLAGMEIELSQILGRHAEIHTVPGLNPRFRDEVLQVAEVQYEQA